MTPAAWKYLLGIVLLAVIVVWIGVFTTPSQNLQIIACDVGQGDAILIQKGTAQVLVDGGPGESVLGCLGRHMPFWDRNIEMIVLTHPDADHVSGLVPVLKQYNVSVSLKSSAIKDTQVYEAFTNALEQEGSKNYVVKNGDAFQIADTYFDIAYPLNTDVKESEVNDYSIVFGLEYGSFDGLFTGDISPKVSDIVAQYVRQVEYLKIPHHGSKNGLSQSLLNATSPDVAVVSVGKDNRYGHPSPEIVEMLEGIKTLRTDELGDVVVETDGQTWWAR